MERSDVHPVPETPRISHSSLQNQCLALVSVDQRGFQPSSPSNMTYMAIDEGIEDNELVVQGAFTHPFDMHLLSIFLRMNTAIEHPDCRNNIRWFQEMPSSRCLLGTCTNRHGKHMF